jgi:WD40 repeat protein
MKRVSNVWIAPMVLVATASMSPSQLTGQATSVTPQEPPTLGELFRIDQATGTPTPLERVKVKKIGVDMHRVEFYIEGSASPVSFKAGEPLQFVVRLTRPGDPADPSGSRQWHRYDGDLNAEEVMKHVRLQQLVVQHFKKGDERILTTTTIRLNVHTYGPFLLTRDPDPRKPDRVAQSFRLTPRIPLTPGQYHIWIDGMHDFELDTGAHYYATIGPGGEHWAFEITAGASQEAIAAIRPAGPLRPATNQPNSPAVISYAGKPQVQILGGDLRVESLAFSPDSKVLATAAGNSTRLWDASTGALLQTVEIWRRAKSGPSHSLLSPPPFLGFSRDSGTLEAGWSGEPGALYDVRTGKVVGGFDTPAVPHGRALSPDGKLMGTGHVAGTVILRDSHTGELVRVLQGHDGPSYSPAFSSDGKTLACGGVDGSILIWDTETWTVLRTLRNTGRVYEIRFSPDGKALAGWTGEDSVGLWRTESGSLLQTLEAHPGGVGPFDFSPDGSVLATAGTEDNNVKLWRWR